MVDFQIPPAAAATKKVFDGDGIPSTSATRPLMFAGPTCRHLSAVMLAESSSNGVWARVGKNGSDARTADRNVAAEVTNRERMGRVRA